MSPLGIQRTRSSLWVIDMQDTLLRLVDDWQRLLDNVIWLAEVARILEVPVLVSEQYPKGLGPTNPDLLAATAPAPVADKVAFSCQEAACFVGLPGAENPQVVLCGIESHVCVLQTALDLLAAGRQVFVVADAVGSRAARDKALAIERLRVAGAQIVSREMVAFEWLGKAGTPEFKKISKEYLQ